MGGEAAGVLALGLPEGLLIGPIAGAQHHHLHIHSHDIVNGGVDQVKALMAHQPGDAANDGHVGVFHQTGGLLEGGLAGLLARQLFQGEVLGQPLILGRVVHVGINAVEDAPDFVAVVGDDPLQPVGVEAVLEFLGIGGGHGGDIVGGIDGPLHQVHVPVVGQHVFVHVPGIEAEKVLEHLTAVTALVLDVMDGVDALGIVELGNAVALLQQVDGRKGGLPVVAVEYIRVPVQVSHALHHRTGEEGEPLAVVIVAIEAGALEIILVVHKPIGHALPLQLKNAAVGGTPAQGDAVALQILHLTAPVLPNALVEGENHAHVMPHSRQGLGQGPRHVGQTAGFDKGSTLRGGKQDIHSSLLIGFSSKICALRRAWSSPGLRRRQGFRPLPGEGDALRQPRFWRSPEDRCCGP